jgi:hypothetical protein
VGAKTGPNQHFAPRLIPEGRCDGAVAPKRLILLAIGLIVLWLIGGFTPPEGADGMVVAGRVMKAWL